MSFLNSGKHSILVTGGSSGIGLELARTLLDSGHEVIAVSRNQSKLDKAKLTCPELIVFAADVSTDCGRKTLFEKISAEYPQVNVLINNAGVNQYPSQMTEFSEIDWNKAKQEINTNLLGYIHLSTLFLPHLLEKKIGMIANVGSIQAFFPVAYTPFYAATKSMYHCLLSFYNTLIILFLPSRYPFLHSIPSTPTEGHLCQGGGDPAAHCADRHASSRRAWWRH
jgi:uncharacterized oxidoreductase